MNKVKMLLIFILVIIILMFLSFISGVFYDQRVSSSISSVTIVDRITDEAFLLTKTVYTDEEIEIVIDQGSDWSNFWWGQSITADALVKVNIGVDLSKISQEDIAVDEYQKRISIDIPQAEVIDALIDGDISLKNEQGLLKLLFASDSDKDYNLAYQALKDQAISAVMQKQEIFTSAEEDAQNLIQLILKDTGYSVIFY